MHLCIGIGRSVENIENVLHFRVCDKNCYRLKAHQIQNNLSYNIVSFALSCTISAMCSSYFFLSFFVVRTNVFVIEMMKWGNRLVCKIAPLTWNLKTKWKFVYETYSFIPSQKTNTKIYSYIKNGIAHCARVRHIVSLH